MAFAFVDRLAARLLDPFHFLDIDWGLRADDV